MGRIINSLLAWLLFSAAASAAPPLFSSQAGDGNQAWLDTVAYTATLLSATGSNLLANGNQPLIQNFAARLYDACGRQDFYLFRSSQNAGTGSYVYSFQGKTMLLVNGPAWSGTGIVFSAASNQYASESGFPAQTAFTARTMMLCLSTGSVGNTQMISTAPNFLNDGYGGISMNLVFGGTGVPFWQYGNCTREL
jgi:hypothetical protein